MQNLRISDLGTSDQQETFINIPLLYLSNLNLTVKHLTKLLKIRLRTEFPESYSILNELNEKVFPLIQCSSKILQYYAQVQNHSQEKSKQDELSSRLNELENTYSKEIKILAVENEELQNQLNSLTDKVNIMQNLLKDSQQISEKLKEKQDIMSQELNFKDAEINKLTQEKQTLKNQQLHLQTLLKQINSEKMQNESILHIKDEIEVLKIEYNKKIDEKEEKIKSLERELKLVQQENLLNTEFKQLGQTINQQQQLQLQQQQQQYQQQQQQQQQQIELKDNLSAKKSKKKIN